MLELVQPTVDRTLFRSTIDKIQLFILRLWEVEAAKPDKVRLKLDLSSSLTSMECPSISTSPITAIAG